MTSTTNISLVNLALHRLICNDSTYIEIGLRCQIDEKFTIGIRTPPPVPS